MVCFKVLASGVLLSWCKVWGLCVFRILHFSARTHLHRFTMEMSFYHVSLRFIRKHPRGTRLRLVSYKGEFILAGELI